MSLEASRAVGPGPRGGSKPRTVKPLREVKYEGAKAQQRTLRVRSPAGAMGHGLGGALGPGVAWLRYLDFTQY